VIGLPDSVRACLFDLDGVLTRTATVHAAAWKEMFDRYLRERAGGFACVVGVDRAGQAEALREHGASIVVSDLSELLEDR
jgi:beta-phosphoglucomutase-like phosphatase (HAD superfamily)